MTKYLFILCLTFLLSGCFTVFKVADKKEDGYFYASEEATVVVSKKFNLDSLRAVILVPNGDFTKGMVQNIRYFGRVINFDELEKEIIQNNKQDEVGSIIGNIGLNNAYRKYMPFLYLKLETIKKEGNIEKVQLKLINPSDFSEIFVDETPLDYVWRGVNDQYTFYPLFNGLIKYVKSNSKTFK